MGQVVWFDDVASMDHKVLNIRISYKGSGSRANYELLSGYMEWS